MPGCNGGGSGFGRSACRLYQNFGILDSSRTYLTVSFMVSLGRAGRAASRMLWRLNGESSARPPSKRRLAVPPAGGVDRDQVSGAADPSGANGPLVRTYGMTPINYFDILASTPGSPGLAPGGTYYPNIRNRNGDGTESCSPTQARCGALAAVRLPR